MTNNPVHLVPRIAEFESARDRVLTDDELRHLWVGLDRIGVALAATIRCLILLGGQRFRQLLRATWADYDALKKTLRLSDPKGKRQKAVDHLLPVGAGVARELEALGELREEGDFVFSSNSGSKPIHHTTISGVIREIARDGSKKMVYRPGDIRRTVETRLQALGVTRDVRAQLLSHGRSGGVQAKHYERHDFLKEKGGSTDPLGGLPTRNCWPANSKLIHSGA